MKYNVYYSILTAPRWTHPEGRNALNQICERLGEYSEDNQNQAKKCVVPPLDQSDFKHVPPSRQRGGLR